MIRIPKIKLKTFLIALPFILSIPTFFVLALERFTTSDYRFCLTCHYQMWGKDFLVQSKVHPPEVRCPECHASEHLPVIPPKDFSAHPSRVNENCMRCHAEMVEKEDQKGFKFNVMKIKFPHRPHLKDYGAICTDCHYNVKHDKHVPVTNRPRMVACWACHDKETTSCLKCHPKGEHLLISLLPKQRTVSKQVCDRCHEGFENRVQEKYGIDFKHTGHLAAGIACSTCHDNEVRHGTIVKSRDECLSCHHKKVKKDCTGCHKIQLAVREGRAIAGITGTPDKMAGFVECAVCHAGISEGHSLEAVKATCKGCHDDSAIKSLDDIQKEVSADIDEVARLYEKLDDKLQPEAVSIAEVLTTVKKDGSRGFHNPEYIKKALKLADQKVTVMVNAEPRQE